ncbi:MAG: hypothetical protein ACI89D_002721, partial [Bermanella sp.]
MNMHTSIDDTALQSVPNAFVKAVLLQARAFGKDIESLIAVAGFTYNPLDVDVAGSATVEQYSRLCLALFRSIDDESGGILAGVSTPLGGTRLLAYSMINCRNLEQALLRAMEFNASCRERGESLVLHELKRSAETKTTRLNYLSGDATQRGLQGSALCSLAMWMRFCAWLIDQPIDIVAAGCASE